MNATSMFAFGGPLIHFGCGWDVQNRQSKIILSLGRLLPLDVVLHAMMDSSVPDQWRSRFAHLLLTLHSSVLPNTALLDHIIVCSSLFLLACAHVNVFLACSLGC